MADTPDDKLMPYADNVMTAAERADLDARLSPADRELLLVFAATGAPVAEAFRPIAEEPVPHHLAELVRVFPIPAAPVPVSGSPPPTRSGFLDMLRDALLGSPWRAAAALSLPLIAGAAIGMSLRGTAPEQVLIASRSDGTLEARGALLSALETAPSDKPVSVRLPGQAAATVEPRVTFKSADGYCRQYDLMLGGARTYAGIACRAPTGAWVSHAHLEVAARSARQPGVTIANASRVDPVVGDIVDRLSTGGVLDASQEADVLKRGWRP